MTCLTITKLDASSVDFDQQLKQLLAWDEADDLDIQQRVLAIIADVRKNGDKAVIDYTNRFDHRNIAKAGELELSKEALKSAWEQLPAEQAQVLRTVDGLQQRVHLRVGFLIARQFMSVFAIHIAT